MANVMFKILSDKLVKLPLSKFLVTSSEIIHSAFNKGKIPLGPAAVEVAS